MNYMIKICDVHKTYQRGHTQVNALQGISMEMNEGEFVSIVGRSGSGKSTLLNMIGGLDTVSSGKINVMGNELTSMNRSQLAIHRSKTVGMVFQSFNLIPSRTAFENVTLALTFGGAGKRERSLQAEELLNQLGLGERIDHKPAELSGGEAQRVAIARALANNPKILLADEPTGNLDSKTSVEIIQLLEELNRKGLTIIMVTHDEVSAQKVSTRIFRLLDGRIVQNDGRPA